MSALHGLLYRLSVADGSTSSIDEPGTFLHLADERLVEEPTGLLVQGAVLRLISEFYTFETHDRDNVTLCDHVF